MNTKKARPCLPCFAIVILLIFALSQITAFASEGKSQSLAINSQEPLNDYTATIDLKQNNKATTAKAVSKNSNTAKATPKTDLYWVPVPILLIAGVTLVFLGLNTSRDVKKKYTKKHK